MVLANYIFYMYQTTHTERLHVYIYLEHWLMDLGDMSKQHLHGPSHSSCYLPNGEP
jgi:hypothetical protein